jgi:2-polyprenyl-3-methyl-5-hydroxy-6-metoxy-1,4-benzoquinol methylase
MTGVRPQTTSSSAISPSPCSSRKVPAEAPDRFDLITVMDAIHDQAKPRAVLKVTYQSLRAGGTYLMGDVRASTDVQQNLNQPLAP